MRFSGFDDEWNEDYLNKLFDNRNERNFESLEVLSVTINDGVLKRSDLGSDRKNKDKKSMKHVLKGDLVYNPMFMWKGASGISSYEGITSADYIVLKSKNNVNPIFFSHLFQTEKSLNKFKNYSQGSLLERLRLMYPQFSDIKMAFPSYEEQEKIANLLTFVDNKIELIEKKYQTYLDFKKYLMQQIFTQKLRFDDNCQYKTKQVKDFLIESKIEGIDDINKRLTVKLNLKGITVRESKTIEIEGATKQFIRKTGQFIYGKQNLHKGAFGIIPKELDGYLTSSDIPSFDFKEGIEPKWFYYYFARKSFYEKLENLSTGTGSKRISPKEFLNIKIIVPEFKEQHKIVCLLEKFDEKINGISNQIVQMNMFKKSLLQQMFVVQLILSLLQNKKHI